MAKHCLAALSLLLLMPHLAAAQPKETASYVGEQACLQCHVIEARHFAHTTHAHAFRSNPRNQMEARVCEACHGPGSRHVTAPTDKTTIIGFTRESATPVAQQTAQCLSCHRGEQRLHWTGSAHQRQDLSCSDCHNPMARISAQGLLRKAALSEVCYGCHQQQRAEFRRRSHMPLPEGKMTCVDCHNPHGSPVRPLMKATSVNEVCYACHAEKRGPFIWEHAPVRENCMNCHQPHGSNHDKLLVSARPYLCQQCHGNLQHPSVFYGGHQTANNVFGQPGVALNSRMIGRSCQNCHTQIHGSNHPAGARFQR